ncbi:MAG: hypothetical protein KME07_09620 [Pegethrix bostrychoides GSE-TBD4-15B]|uniref:Mannosyltransferase n=1 Tax=Pegethrix bostrychoides GSE-TBD4-15B TaxID=2839662 RepID=A0A951PA63_9CYAN|nr:hypothetical protein [Pegethrix bostrychoides GSE-TBD4-15B]
MLKDLLSLPTRRPLAPRQSLLFWLGLSLAFGLVYGILVWQQAFSGEYVVQDDARQHVFWMQRFVNPQAFPNDLIADYFESVAPAGYTWLYRIAATLGLDPLLTSKLLPPILGLLSTVACFFTMLEMLPLPLAGFVASLLLNQTLWMNDDLVSATPRAFFYPLFLGFCYFLLRRWLLPCLGLILLQGWFYPQAVFLEAGLLVTMLVSWSEGRLRLSRSVRDYLFCGIGLAVCVAVMLPYALGLSQFDPVVTLAEAQQMPEFQNGGRSDFFNDNPWKFWLTGLRSGLMPRMARLPELLGVALLLPVILGFRRAFPLTRQLQPAALLLPQMLAVSLFWFGAAHLLLFKLHLPSRYTQHTLRILLCWAAAMTIVIGLDGLKHWANQQADQPQRWRRWLTIGVAAITAAALVLYPSYTPEFPRARYIKGEQPALYQFFAQQPAETLIASLSEEASNLPSFAQRSVYVAKEYAIPYHMGYYAPFRQRVLEVIRAQYSPNLAELKQWMQTTGVEFWLLDRAAFTPKYLEESWIDQYPEALRQAKRWLKREPPALSRVAEDCVAFQNARFVVLNSACILSP